MRRRLALLLALAVVPAASGATGPSLRFSVFAETDLPLGQVTWTGREWLYVAENLGRIEAADADGADVRPFAAFDQGGEEMRCSVPPNGLWPDGVYCHTPDNRVVRLDRDGSNLVELARLPAAGNSDGALAFDDAGRFGYALLVATGGSGSDGGQVFAVRKDGRVQTLGSYPGPGGAENIAVAPARFGAAGGWCLIAIDQDSVSGRLLAIDRKGNLKTIATGLGSGLNPVVVVRAPPPGRRPPGSPAPGLYLADTTSREVWFAPASGFAGYAGSVLVATELTAQAWLVRPKGAGFETLPVATDLPQRPWNLEGSAYVP
ncbi:MAG TPA: hypothetical protein VFB42_04070 [Gaiellaceae bacterium]|nr:hypothetical protein [Gaiellaceae bacterium]